VGSSHHNLEALKAVVDDMPMGILLFSPDVEIMYSNKEANLFMKCMRLPEEIPSFCRRIFDSWYSPRPFLNSKEIVLRRKPQGSLNYWLFRLRVIEMPARYLSVYMNEESVIDRLNLDEVRNRYRLTRREVDVMRRMLRGMTIVHIAQDLALKEQTVKEYLSNIYIKLEVKSKFEAMSLILGSGEFYYDVIDSSSSIYLEQMKLFDVDKPVW
jgi:DNA-binding CsgD family transcriptional regulator